MKKILFFTLAVVTIMLASCNKSETDENQEPEEVVATKFVLTNETIAEAPQGEGTEASPFLIKTAANIKYFQDEMHNQQDEMHYYYKLLNDIEIKVDVWKPLQLQKGTFDGGGHEISGRLVAADDLEYDFGIFGRVYESTVTNLTNVAEIYAPKVYAVGGIIGTLDNSKVINCTNKGKITANTATGGIVGGIHYTTKATEGEFTLMHNCTNSGEVITLETIDTYHFATGGLIGDCYCEPANAATNIRFIISECNNSGKVSASTGGQYVGGIIGCPANTDGYLVVKKCTNTGTITKGTITATEDIGTTDHCVGLLIGGPFTGYSDGTAIIE